MSPFDSLRNVANVSLTLTIQIIVIKLKGYCFTFRPESTCVTYIKILIYGTHINIDFIR